MKTYIKAIIFSIIFLSFRNISSAQVEVGVSISANIPPPPLPVYDQPPCPVDGWLWVPGYWAFDPQMGYYWIPGVWVVPPQIGWLWTPPYWAFYNGIYVWHRGYWGPDIGFYGGIDYGWGYPGTGYIGGVWEGGIFRYNTAVTRVNTTVVHNVYVNRTVINNTTIINNRISYNGGNGGIHATPTSFEQRAMNERHLQPTTAQLNHIQAMHQDRNQFANVNHGSPSTVVMNRVDGRGFDARGRESRPATSPAPVPNGGAQPQNRPLPNSPVRPAQPSRTPDHRYQPTPSQPEPATPRPEVPPRRQTNQPQPNQPERQPDRRYQPSPAQPEPAMPRPENPPRRQTNQPQPNKPERRQPMPQPQQQQRPAQHDQPNHQPQPQHQPMQRQVQPAPRPQPQHNPERPQPSNPDREHERH